MLYVIDFFYEEIGEFSFAFLYNKKELENVINVKRCVIKFNIIL